MNSEETAERVDESSNCPGLMPATLFGSGEPAPYHVGVQYSGTAPAVPTLTESEVGVAEVLNTGITGRTFEYSSHSDLPRYSVETQLAL